MADRSRIILDLAQPAVVAKAEVRKVRGGFGELDVELKRASRAEFQAASVRPAPQPEEGAAAIQAPKPHGETRSSW